MELGEGAQLSRELYCDVSERESVEQTKVTV